MSNAAIKVTAGSFVRLERTIYRGSQTIGRVSANRDGWMAYPVRGSGWGDARQFHELIDAINWLESEAK